METGSSPARPSGSDPSGSDPSGPNPSDADSSDPGDAPGTDPSESDQLVTAWRVDKKAHHPGVFEGIGGEQVAGRWHSKGQRISYAAEHQALAMLEKLVWLTSPEEAEGEAFILAPITFDPKRHVMTLPPARLPKGWDGFPHLDATRRIGDKWLRHGRAPILKVPSAVLPTAFNYLVNPGHEDFPELEQGDPIAITFDARLFYTPPEL